MSAKDATKKHARLYWERVRDKAAELGTDGCTGASSAFRDCCLEHDVLWRTGKTLDGKRITKQEANERFLACMQSRSIFGWYSPMAWWRYWAVRMFGR